MSGLFGDPADFLLALLFKIPALLLAVTVHELAHGLVADRLVNPGERVAVDGKLFAIADLDTMEVEALVPARDVPQLKMGQKVTLRVEGFGERAFEGQVDRINPTAQSGSRSIPRLMEAGARRICGNRLRRLSARC